MRASTTGTRVVGVDCAVQPKNIGVALARWDGEGCRIEHVVRGDAIGAGPKDIARWIAREIDAGTAAVFALDAPLGWPRSLGDALASHTAGAPLPVAPHQMFRRHTDRELAARLAKHPLEVGADRIARTALATLELLEHLREALGSPVPVPTSSTNLAARCAIEVYPAGTLKALRLRHERYKRPSQRDAREEILDGLVTHVIRGVDRAPLLEDANLLDAVVAVVAGVDFLRGRATPPPAAELARKEGWIWVRSVL